MLLVPTKAVSGISPFFLHTPIHTDRTKVHQIHFS